MLKNYAVILMKILTMCISHLNASGDRNNTESASNGVLGDEWTDNGNQDSDLDDFLRNIFSRENGQEINLQSPTHLRLDSYTVEFPSIPHDVEQIMMENPEALNGTLYMDYKSEIDQILKTERIKFCDGEIINSFDIQIKTKHSTVKMEDVIHTDNSVNPPVLLTDQVYMFGESQVTDTIFSMDTSMEKLYLPGTSEFNLDFFLSSFKENYIMSRFFRKLPYFMSRRDNACAWETINKRVGVAEFSFIIKSIAGYNTSALHVPLYAWAEFCKLFILKQERKKLEIIKSEPRITLFYQCIARSKWVLHDLLALLRRSKQRSEANPLFIDTNPNYMSLVKPKDRSFIDTFIYLMEIFTVDTNKRQILENAKNFMRNENEITAFEIWYHGFTSASFVMKFIEIINKVKGGDQTIRELYKNQLRLFSELLTKTEEGIFDALNRMDESYFFKAKFIKSISTDTRVISESPKNEPPVDKIFEAISMEYAIHNAAFLISNFMNVARLLLLSIRNRSLTERNYKDMTDGTVFTNIIINDFDPKRMNIFLDILKEKYADYKNEINRKASKPNYRKSKTRQAFGFKRKRKVVQNVRKRSKGV